MKKRSGKALRKFISGARFIPIVLASFLVLFFIGTNITGFSVSLTDPRTINTGLSLFFLWIFLFLLSFGNRIKKSLAALVLATSIIGSPGCRDKINEGTVYEIKHTPTIEYDTKIPADPSNPHLPISYPFHRFREGWYDIKFEQVDDNGKRNTGSTTIKERDWKNLKIGDFYRKDDSKKGK